MVDTNLAKKESEFAEIIWDNEPISSPELVKLAEEKLNWKKSTTYTMLKILCKKGIFKNEKAVVSKVVSKDEFGFLKGKRLIEENFNGSLPAFMTAFTSRTKLSENEIKDLYELLDSYMK